MNPFGDSMPFPDSAPTAGYEKMEEVSLEQLLSEGRERPATMADNVPIPVAIDDVEEMGAEEMVPQEETPVAVAFMEEREPDFSPAYGSNGRVAELEAQVEHLEAKMDAMRHSHREQLDAILHSIGELSRTVRKHLDS